MNPYLIVGLLTIFLAWGGNARAASNDCFATASAPTYEEGRSAPCSVTLDGKIRVDAEFSGEITGADGAITDGASPSIKATVKDYTNSNPLTTIIVDTNGDPAAIGGGTEYTEDAASAANPVGKMSICRRRDTLTASEVSADSDNIATNCTSKGEIYVKQTDAVPVTDNGGSLTVDGSVSITGSVTVTDGAGALNVIVDSGTTAATQSGTWNITNISGTVSLPTGAATAANQDGIIKDGTGDTTQANVSSGSLHVACQSGCSGGTQYDEDTAHVSGDKLTLSGFVRQDADGPLAADGDRSVGQVDANGYIKVVNKNPNLAADNSTNSTSKVPVLAGTANASAPSWTEGRQVPLSTDLSGALRVTGGTAATQYAEDAAETAGAQLSMAGSVRRDTAASSAGTTGDNATINTDANGKLWTNADNTAINGVAISVGNGASGTGVQRVTLANDSTGNLATIGTSVTPGTSAAHLGKAEDAAHASGDTGVAVLTKRTDAAATSAGTDADYATLNTDANGLLWTRTSDPCTALAKTFIPINISTATTTELTPSLAGASTNYYVCSLNLVTAGANNVALTDDDTDNCASVTSGLAGGTTAASGWNFAANGGMTFGNGQSSVFKTNGANRVLCLVTSAAVQLSGTITVVSAP